MTLCLVCLIVLLSGCSAVQTFETVSDEVVEPVMGQMREIAVALPDRAVIGAMDKTDGSGLYLCDGYSVMLQTMESGDLDATVRSLSGFSADSLMILKTKTDEGERYDWVWTAVGEGGDQLCRAAVLDDGSYHYCLSVAGDAALAGSLEEEWAEMFSSFTLS